MPFFHRNNNYFRDILPRMEDREYCLLLQKTLRSCREKNYENHPPCRQLEEFITVLDCFSLNKKPIYKPIAVSHDETYSTKSWMTWAKISS